MDEDNTNEKYTFFDKTADAKFQAFGYTLEEAFKNAEEAMISVMYKIEDIIDYDLHTEDREIQVESDNLEGLLYRFLEEIVFLLSAESFVGLVEKIVYREIDGIHMIAAKIHGTQCYNLESQNEVKAVTYNEMFVKYDKETQKYTVQVVVDI